MMEKAITARDLKSLERLTIARAKCEGRTSATISDAKDAIRIYKESLIQFRIGFENSRGNSRR